MTKKDLLKFLKAYPDNTEIKVHSPHGGITGDFYFDDEYREKTILLTDDPPTYQSIQERQ